MLCAKEVGSGVVVVVVVVMCVERVLPEETVCLCVLILSVTVSVWCCVCLVALCRDFNLRMLLLCMCCWVSESESESEWSPHPVRLAFYQRGFCGAQLHPIPITQTPLQLLPLITLLYCQSPLHPATACVFVTALSKVHNYWLDSLVFSLRPSKALQRKWRRVYRELR